MPAGTIGCEVLNIPDNHHLKIWILPCNVLNHAASGDATRFRGYGCWCGRCSKPLTENISFLQVTPPFSRLIEANL